MQWRFALTRIPHAENVQADALAALVSSSDPRLKRVIPVEFIEHPSIEPPNIMYIIQSQVGDTDKINLPSEENSVQPEFVCDKPWLETIRAYITDEELPTENGWPEKWKFRLPDTL